MAVRSHVRMSGKRIAREDVRSPKDMAARSVRRRKAENDGLFPKPLSSLSVRNEHTQRPRRQCGPCARASCEGADRRHVAGHMVSPVNS